MRHAVLLLAVAVAAACSAPPRPLGMSRHSSPPAALLLPGLPGGTGAADGAKGGAPAAPRRATAQSQLVVLGSDTFDRHLDTVVNGTTLEFDAGAGELEWAIYELPGIGADYYPVDLTCSAQAGSGSYWVALANYDAGRWDIQPGPISDDATIPIADYSSLVSGGDGMFVAVLVSESALVYTQTAATMEDARPMPAPTGLTAAAGSASATLTWDAYSDSRATDLRVHQGEAPDLSDAMQVGTAAPDETTYTVNGLVPGKTYYFAVQAYWLESDLLSAFSNIAEATPTGRFSLGGVWGRLGGRADGGGFTGVLGPESFDNFKSEDVSALPAMGSNCTSPVVDSSGNVFALTRDAKLVSFTRKLAAKRFTYDANDVLPDRGYLAASTSPVLDADGNVYFVALPPETSSGRDGYLVSLTNTGDVLWPPIRLGECKDTSGRPYPAPNFTDGGLLLVAGENNCALLTFDEFGDPVWTCSFAPSRVVYADPALNGIDEIQVPIWFNGIGIDPRDHWVSVDGFDGSELAHYRYFGGPENLLGGLPLPFDLHVYPENDKLILLDPATGDYLTDVAFDTSLDASPARNETGDWIFQPESMDIDSLAPAQLWGVQLGLSDPPKLSKIWNLTLERVMLSSKPAVDGAGAIFFANTSGMLYRAAFDPEQPLGPRNPEITDSQRLDIRDTYGWNSFALDSGYAYIVTQQGTLYCIHN
jgi:hypothetical protein